MNLYSYCGPVTVFDRCVASHWSGRTYAASEKKAFSNLIFQYKTQNGLVLRSRVGLPGKLEKCDIHGGMQ